MFLISLQPQSSDQMLCHKANRNHISIYFHFIIKLLLFKQTSAVLPPPPKVLLFHSNLISRMTHTALTGPNRLFHKPCPVPHISGIWHVHHQPAVLSHVAL